MSRSLFDNLNHTIEKVLDELICYDILSYEKCRLLLSGIEFSNAFQECLNDFDYYNQKSNVKLFFLHNQIDDLFNSIFIFKNLATSNNIHINTSIFHYKECFLAILHSQYSQFTKDLESDEMIESGIHYFTSFKNLKNHAKSIWIANQQMKLPSSEVNFMCFSSPIKRIHSKFNNSISFNSKNIYFFQKKEDEEDNFIQNPPYKVFETYNNPILDYENFLVFYNEKIKNQTLGFAYDFVINQMFFVPFISHFKTFQEGNHFDEKTFHLSTHKSLFSIYKTIYMSLDKIKIQDFLLKLSQILKDIPPDHKQKLYSLFDITTFVESSSTWQSNKQLVEDLRTLSPNVVEQLKSILEEDFLNNNIPVNKLKSGNILKF